MAFLTVYRDLTRVILEKNEEEITIIKKEDSRFTTVIFFGDSKINLDRKDQVYLGEQKNYLLFNSCQELPYSTFWHILILTSKSPECKAMDDYLNSIRN